MTDTEQRKIHRPEQIVWNDRNDDSRRRRQRASRFAGPDMLLSPLISSKNKPSNNQTAADLGGLKFKPFSDMRNPDRAFLLGRRIRPKATAKLYEQERHDLLRAIDDRHLGPKYDSFEDRDWDPDGCLRPSWAYDSYLNCNTFHELDLSISPHQVEQQFDISYIAHGYYRETYSFASKTTNQNKPTQQQQQQQQRDSPPPRRFVLKHLRFKDYLKFNHKYFDSMHNEALVMEALSGSSRTSDIYGYCATSLLVEQANEFTYTMIPERLDIQSEQGRMSQKQLDVYQKTDVHPMNNFTMPEKLNVAISIAEALAEMHGYAGGVIIHDDVHPDQWLIADDGRVILNDINNAIVLRWNASSEEYCPYPIKYGGDFRAPEEYRGEPAILESADVWPMGNMLYSLLTGLYPYYDHVNSKDIQRITLNGTLPFLDARYRNRSFIESRLVEIMEQCHKMDPKERVDIFEVVRHLKETRRLFEGQQHVEPRPQ